MNEVVSNIGVVIAAILMVFFTMHQSGVHEEEKRYEASEICLNRVWLVIIWTTIIIYLD